jgi:transcriptional regulator with XRE-family HTH domain
MCKLSGMTPDEWRTTVGSRIQARREEMGITVEAAARFAGFSRSWWRQLEQGYRNDGGTITTINPKAESLAGAARAIGWTPDSINRLRRGLEPIAMEAPNGHNGHHQSWERETAEAILSEIRALRTDLSDHREAVEADAGTRRTIDALVEQVRILTEHLGAARQAQLPSSRRPPRVG